MDEFNSQNNYNSGNENIENTNIENDRTDAPNNFNSNTNYENMNRDSNFSTGNFEDLKTSSFYNESYKKPSKGRWKGILVPMIIVALLSSVLTGGIVGAYFTFGLPDNYRGNSSDKMGQNVDVKKIEIVGQATSVEAAVAEKASRSIVGINVTFSSSNMFFGTVENHGSGSGIIYRSDGYIVTNNHVVQDAMSGPSGNKIAPGSKIQVILPNQVDKPYEATIVGRDSKTDIAILKINASELPAAEFANSDEVKVGEKAIAIGNPAGLEFMGSVTSGIISGLNRTLEFDDGKSMKLIQTDAAINPGNSGGALLNANGQVIGINSSKIGGEGYEGLGFAIPSNIAAEIAENLIQSGYVKGRPKLGISIDPRFNKDIAEKNKVPEGVLVYDVEPLSGAYKADIKTGDILTEFNGVEIKSFDELETEKNKCKAGDTVKITLYRLPNNNAADKGEYMTVEVVLGEDMG